MNIRKKIIILVSILPIVLIGQDKLSKLQAPSSPAASILGLQPSSVLSPKSYQALETALFSNFTNISGNNIVPDDFSLEFTPYWTKDHSLSIEEYLYPKSFLDQLIRSSSFSLASTQNYLLGDSTSTNGIAYGYRATFYFSNNNDREIVSNSIKEIRTNQNIQSKIGAEAYSLIYNGKITTQTEFITKIKSTINKAILEADEKIYKTNAEKLTNQIIAESTLIPSLDFDSPQPFLDSLFSIIDTKLSSEIIYNEFKNYIKKRHGLSLDIAYAGLINFPTNNFGKSYVPRQSFWIIPTYRFKEKFNFLKAMIVIRYEWFDIDYYQKYFAKTKIYENNIDYGISIATTFNKFSLTFELVGRKSNSKIPAGTDNRGNTLYKIEDKSDFQYIGSFNYSLTNEIVISYIIGNRFDPILNPNNTLVSTLSLNLGFGGPSIKEIKID